MSNCQIYNVGIYARLSREDERNSKRKYQDTSESIQNQLNYLMRYVVEKGWNLIDQYTDDGYTGTNFNRPDFEALIKDIEADKVNCVITKDLSRLGRDHIDLGKYLEIYFPEKDIRYIALNDGMDSEDERSYDMLHFRLAFNETYSKDISKKVRTALQTKVQNGEFIGSVSPYGYKKDEKNKNQLIIDEETAEVVRRIYSMYIEGSSKRGIANQLSAEKIPTPSQVKNLAMTQKRQFKGIWNETAISNILTNPTYIGNLAQNKTRKVSYKSEKRKKFEKKDWIIIEGTHERIISSEDFATVQHLIAQKGYRKFPNKPAHLLSGIAKCGDCGDSMTFTQTNTPRVYLACQTWRRRTKLNLCTSHNIRESVVEEEVINALRQFAKLSLDKNKIADSVNYCDNDLSKLEREIDKLNGKLGDISKIISALFKDKVRGIIAEEDFIEMSREYQTERETITKSIKRAQSQLDKISNQHNSEYVREILDKFLTFDTIDRQTLALLVNKVEIFDDKSIKIHFNFKP